MNQEYIEVSDDEQNQIRRLTEGRNVVTDDDVGIDAVVDVVVDAVVDDGVNDVLDNDVVDGAADALLGVLL